MPSESVNECRKYLFTKCTRTIENTSAKHAFLHYIKTMLYLVLCLKLSNTAINVNDCWLVSL